MHAYVYMQSPRRACCLSVQVRSALINSFLNSLAKDTIAAGHPRPPVCGGLCTLWHELADALNILRLTTLVCAGRGSFLLRKKLAVNREPVSTKINDLPIT